MKKRILTVIGARPQIIKAAAISRAVSQLYSDRIEESILHTGQHYDDNMSRVFFAELGIPAEAYNLGVGSGDHGAQTAMMLAGIEKILMESRPDGLLIYGDTNSTLAGALAASKLHIPVFHVEAGLRSFDKTMPEEINRVVADHVSTVLFAPTDTAVRNLAAEGIVSHDVAVNTPDRPLVVKTGDVMYDNALYYRNLAAGKGSHDQPFILATIHRDHNTDHPERLRKLMDALGQVAAMYSQPVLLPLHPRTAKCISALEADGWKMSGNIQILNPVSYLEMIALESACSLVITDSGGVQKEAFFFQKPCIILRPHTEWVEIVAGGNATIAGDDPQKILKAAEHYLKHTPDAWPEIFGDGHAAEKIVEVILKTI